MLLMTKVISVQKITRIYEYLEVALGCNFCEQSPFLKGNSRNTACDDMSLVRGDCSMYAALYIRYNFLWQRFIYNVYTVNCYTPLHHKNIVG